MAKRTVSSYFLPKPNDIEKTNPQNESDSCCEETVVAKKGRKFSFRDEWLREFTWLRAVRCGAAGFVVSNPSREGGVEVLDNADTMG
ncbi:hypothetical protein EYF80_027287 [Liparis tanakae]|uniref:Uncharacterized protein n=1 Tax=Liparis tanakae TaxID=230148 RepID=A0A4Z2HC64_9TELE|nr:hypothetical protein EYF80_027287 [Liparis tanakae]